MGTKTFGRQCADQLSFRIMDRAWDAGFVCLAAPGTYPVSPTPDAVGALGEIFGLGS